MLTTSSNIKDAVHQTASLVAMESTPVHELTYWVMLQMLQVRGHSFCMGAVAHAQAGQVRELCIQNFRLCA
jgi:hypothetical protein